jgi:type III pantothenate kinase
LILRSFGAILKMNLAIDIGNSRVKTGIFVKGKLVKDSTYDSFTMATLKTIFRENPEITGSILCSVKKYPASFRHFLTKQSRFVELTSQTPVPVKVAYKTPKTLGMDRLAAICGAQSIYKAKNILVINAGTCITYDFMNKKAVYLGGSISPGLEMRYKALHTFTGGLPLIVPDMNFKKLTGASTEESIRSGVQLGMVKEVEGIIREYQASYEDLTILLTGGSMVWLLKSLKIKIKAEPYLVLTGLNVILSLFQNQSTPLASANRF